MIRARQQVTQAQSQVVVAEAALDTLLGREPNVLIGPLAPLPSSIQPFDEEASPRQALANRAEIASEAAGRDAFLQEARLARAEGRPDLAPQFRMGSITSGFRGPGLGLGLSLPLFDLGSRRNRVRQAEEAARAQTDRIAAAQNLVRQEVAQALARLRAAQATIRDYQDGVLIQARRLLEASRTGFQEGSPRYTILTVLEAQRTYRGVQTEYINALATQAQALAELERSTGAVPATLVPAIVEEPRRSK